MISKENLKYCIFIAIISIIIYKFIDNPQVFINGIGKIANFFSPFLIAILISLLMDPIINFLERKCSLKKLLSIFLSYIIVISIILLGLKLLIPSLLNTLNALIKEMPNYINSANEFLATHTRKISYFETLLPHLQHDLNDILQNLVSLLSGFSADILDYIFNVTSIIFNILMAIVLSAYMLFDKEKIAINLKNLLYSLFSTSKSKKIITFFHAIHDVFYNYIASKVIDSIIVGIIAFIGFKFILRIENSMFLSFIVFLTNIIPYFGPFIGAVPPILMTLVTSPSKTIWIALFIFILQQLDGNFIGPKIMGDQIGLSPLWIISAVLIGGKLFGFIGVFLSVPVAALVKILLMKYIEDNIPTNQSR